jgi:hypothetical protein
MNTLILLAENTLNPRGKPDDWFPGASVTAIFIERICPRMRSDEKSPKRNGVLNVKLMILFAEPWKGEKYWQKWP